MTDPYRRFLAATDVDVWSACLDDLEGAAESAADDERLAGVLAEGLCVAIYLRWLAHACGAQTVMDRAGERFGDLRARVLGAGERDTAAWRRCQALVLVNDGYPVHARALLGEEGIQTPELAVLLVRGDDVRRLVTLRGFVRGTPPTTFLPAVYDYTLALVGIGGLREAQHVLETGGWDEDEPLLIDLWAGIHERLGQWAAAYAAYRRSRWPEHRYRAAVVGTISGRAPETAALEVDEPIRQVLLRGESELDQAGMTRSMAFINACLWQRVESWMLEHELGRLCFRRRQFAEADVHLSRALLTAPQAARYPIAELRSINLTWLTGNSRQRTLSLLPEALAAGAEAVRLGGATDTAAGVRLWMAERSGDRSLLPASFASWPAYERAMAYAAVDAPAQAVNALVEAIGTAFNHRAVGDLICHLQAAGLLRAVVHLADVVFREADTTFFALWETCLVLQRLLATDEVVIDDSAAAAGAPDAEGSAEDELGLLADRYRNRLVELSQLEFMNAIRTCDIAILARYEDLAEELLLRAAKQAEGVSELLAVAVQRRTDVPRSVHSDQEALSCLARARNIARDRLERLEIARELFCYGAIREGRSILQEEGVLSAQTPLTHSEMTVALQCAPWCTEDERTDLAGRAARQLARDEAAGVLGPYPEVFIDRLITTVSQFAPSNAVQVRRHLNTGLTRSARTRAWSGDAADEWPAAMKRIDELLGSDEETAATELTAHLDELSASGSFGLRLLAVKHLRGKLATLQQEIRDVLPTVPAPQIPVERWYDDLEGPRVIGLCDVWRFRILGAEDTDLREFLAREQQLAEVWEQRRGLEGAPIRRRIARTADALEQALTTLLDADQRTSAHPILRGLFAAIQRDVERLVREAAEQAATARRQLGAAAPAEDPP